MKQALLLLALLGLPLLGGQLTGPTEHLDADAVLYFSHLRSLYFDHDLDFANEFAHFGILTRGDKVRPTATSHRPTIFSVGPAILWMPFYAGGDLVARLAGQREDGYSRFHIRAVCLGSLVYGLAGLVLLWLLLEPLFGARIAGWTSALLLYATFLLWYLVYEAALSHALRFFAAALALFVWWEGRRNLRPGRALATGLVIGLAATVRGQNAVLLLLPALSLLRAWPTRPRERGSLVRTGALVLLAFAVFASPQLFAGKALFGQYLLAFPPPGRDFLRLGHPFLLNTFFSSRHGLLYWTPVLWGGLLGLGLLFRRDRFTAFALAVPLLVMSYLNACSGDWWAGDSFSNRRFDSALPLLAPGLAAALGAVLTAVQRRPQVVTTFLGLAFVLWNQLLIVQYREKKIPADDTVSFAAVTAYNAKLVGRYVGTPVAWPANLVFARQHDLPAARYDLLVGKYLFHRQNNLGGLVKVSDPRAFPALFAGDWSAPVACGDAVCREVLGRARVMAPLDRPEDLDLTVRAQGEGTLALRVNGREVATFPLEEETRGRRARVPESFWRRELNDVSLSVSAGGRALVERLLFERVSDGHPPGQAP